MPPGPLHNFGLGPNQRRNTFENNQDGYAGRSTQMRHNATQMYPPDPPGEAAGENGRVWKIYRDRVNDIDDELLQGWNDALNTLLVFAGLFSAACTAFLIEVSKSLQPDWQRATSLAVFAIYAHLNSTSPPPFEVPNPLLFSPPLDARWINGLWFTSLTLSLVVSLLAILAKQWLNEFKSRMRKPASSPKAWALRHSVFKGGLERWSVDAMISILPLLLHAALFLFLIGLGLMLLPLDNHVAGVVIGISGGVSVLYVAAGIAPVFWSDCPSATPALRYAFSLWNYVVVPADLLADTVVDKLENTRFWERIDRSDSYWALFIPEYCRGTAKPRFDRAEIPVKDQPLHEASVLAWMIRMLPAQDDVASALYVVGILPGETLFHLREEDNPLFHEDLQRVTEVTLNGIIIKNASSEIDDGTIAIFLRACIIVSRRPPQLSEPVRSFLKEAMSRDALEQDPIVKLTLYGSDQSRHLRIRGENRSYKVVYMWEIARLAVLTSSLPQQPFLPIAVTAFKYSVRHALREPIPPTIKDPKLLFIATSDKLLCSIIPSHGWVPLGSVLISVCAAAARELKSAHATTPLPPNLQEQLRFISTNEFLDCDLSAADLSAIATLLSRSGSSIPPLALHHILYHFQKRQLPIDVDELTWIWSAFQPPPVTSDLMNALSVFPFTDDVFHTSRLSLLQPIQFIDLQTFTAKRSSPWSVLLDTSQTPETAELVAEMACTHTVLLLALYQRGQVEPAQDMLHKLLPRNRCAPVIAHGTRARYHLALHAKMIDASWWGELRDELVSLGEWTSHPPLVHPDVSSFIEAVEAPNNCLECVPAGVVPPLVVVPPLPGGAPEDGGAATDGDVADDSSVAAEDVAGDGGTVTDDDAADSGEATDDDAEGGAAPTGDTAEDDAALPPDDAAEGIGAAPRIHVTSGHPPAAEGGAARTYNPRGAEEV